MGPPAAQPLRRAYDLIINSASERCHPNHALLLNATCEAMSLSPFEARVYMRLQSQRFSRMKYRRAARMIEACWYRYKAYKKRAWCTSKAAATSRFCTALHRFRHYRSEGEKRKYGNSKTDGDLILNNTTS